MNNYPFVKERIDVLVHKSRQKRKSSTADEKLSITLSFCTLIFMTKGTKYSF